MAPNAPPLPSGEVGSPPGAHHDASGSSAAGSTQPVCRVRSQSPSGRESGGVGSRVVLRPCTLPASRRAPDMVSATCHTPSPSTMATAESSGAESSAKPPPPRGMSRSTRWGARPSSDALRSASATTRPGPSPSPRSPAATERSFWTTEVAAAVAAASSMVCQPVQRHRWADSPRSTAPRSSRRPFTLSASRRMTIPGVQNPHWEPPVEHSARDQPERVTSSRPSRVVISRPATRRSGVTQLTRGSPSTQTVQHPH